MDGRLPGDREVSGRQNPAYRPTRLPPHAALGPGNVIMPNPAALATGTVLIGGLPAARARDQTSCGAMVLTGAPTVLIGGV